MPRTRRSFSSQFKAQTVLDLGLPESARQAIMEIGQSANGDILNCVSHVQTRRPFSLGFVRKPGRPGWHAEGRDGKQRSAGSGFLGCALGSALEAGDFFFHLIDGLFERANRPFVGAAILFGFLGEGRLSDLPVAPIWFASAQVRVGFRCSSNHLNHLHRPIFDRKSGYMAESLVVADEDGTER